MCLHASMKAAQRSSRFRSIWLGDKWQAVDSTGLGSELRVGQGLKGAFSGCLTLLPAVNNSRRSHALPMIFLFSAVCPIAPGAAVLRGRN